MKLLKRLVSVHNPQPFSRCTVSVAMIVH